MVSAMSDVNKGQVGGTHYKADFMHWDWVEACHLGYMEGQITRYVIRWYKKDGIQDLQKALHYVDKLLEMHRYSGRTNPRWQRWEDLVSPTERLFEQTQTPPTERSIIRYVRDWSQVGDLIDIRQSIADLIKEKENEIKP